MLSIDILLCLLIHSATQIYVPALVPVSSPENKLLMGRYCLPPGSSSRINKAPDSGPYMATPQSTLAKQHYEVGVAEAMEASASVLQETHQHRPPPSLRKPAPSSPLQSHRFRFIS